MFSWGNRAIFFKQYNQLNQRGALVFIMSILMAVISITMLALSVSLVQKTKVQIGVMKYTRKEGIINAITDHAINELKASFAAGGACSLVPLVGGSSTNWNALAPQFYHVGLFQIDILDSLGVPTGRFESPEDPPKVWLTQIGVQELYKLHIETSICKTTIGGGIGRAKIPKATVDADLVAAPLHPWVTPPSSFEWAAHSVATCLEKIPLSYTGIIDPSSWGGIWTIYLDRGYYSNLAQDEPADLVSIDSESFYGSALAFENVSGIGDAHMTGATDEKSMAGSTCSAASRTASAYASIAGTIKTLDPCGKMAIYTVGGGSSLGAAQNPPWKIVPLTTPIISPTEASFVLNSAGWSSILLDLANACAKKPAGYFNIAEVAQHYVQTHQDAAYTLPAADRSKTHVMVLVTDGTGFGTLRPPTEPNIGGVRRPINRSNIYYQAMNGDCSGQGYIEASMTTFDPNAWYVSGETLYEFDSIAGAPSALALPSLSPPLAPIPGSSKRMGSVRSALTGSCEPIFTTGPTAYSGIEYPYFIRDPKAVKARVSAPLTLTAVLDQYTPYAGWINAFTNIVSNPATGLQDYPNAFMMFPLPVTDLDEADLMSFGFSKRPFDIGAICKKDRESVVAAYSQTFSMLNLKSFKSKSSFEGLICP